MKVVPKKYNTDAVLLSLNLTKHMTKILKKQFDFIVEPAPEVTFFMCDNEMSIKEICFEAIDFETAITIDDENILLHLGQTSHLLFEHEGFESLLDIEEDDLYDIGQIARVQLNEAKSDCKIILKEMENE